MKKTLYFIGAAILLVALASCQKEAGSKPGSDGSPLVTAYKYAAPKGYNADEDVQLRFVKNDKVKAAYFLEELSSAKKAAIEADGESAYIAKVIEQGTEIEFEDGVRDTILTGLANYYDITVVAVNGSKKVVSSLVFEGVSWKPGVVGTYTFTLLNNKIGVPSPVTTEMQQCEFDENLYRFKDLYGAGRHLKFKLTGEDPVNDGRGPFKYFRVAEGQGTGFSYGDYGEIFVRDCGYSPAYGEEYFYSLGDDYECGLYEDGHCNLNLDYYVGAGRLGAGWDETFVPNP